MVRESTGVVRTLGIYLTLAFAALQALDVLLDRAGLPERLFTQASIAVVLLLPAAVAVGLIRRFLADDDRPKVRPTTVVGPRSEVRKRHRAGATTAGRELAPGVEPTRAAQASERGLDLGQRPGALAPASGEPGELAAVHLRLARLYDERGEPERALPHYERYVALTEGEPDTPDAPAAAPKSD